MKIAILAWGSLLWDRGNLALKTGSDWTLGGPELPIEFSRVSAKTRAGALTLVIDPQNGVNVPTYFAISANQNLNEAIANLREREGTVAEKIGYVNAKNGKSRSNAFAGNADIIHAWAEKNGFDGVIWSDLPSNFNDPKVNKREYSNVDDPAMKFSLDNAQIYLHGLKASGARNACEYLLKAPQEVETPLRKRMREDPWLYRSGSF